MSPTPQDILSSFDVLPEAQQQLVAAEILRRTVSQNLEPLSDDALSAVADELFLELDRREAQFGESPAK